jgi:hypothetical protein
MDIRGTAFGGVVGIALGLMSAVLIYWVGAVITLLSLRGIPLGSSGGPPTLPELALHLLFAAAGCAVGGYVALRLAKARLVPALIVGLALAVAAVVGFGKPISSWPRGFALAMAAACLSGTLIAAAVRGWLRRSPGIVPPVQL